MRNGIAFFILFLAACGSLAVPSVSPISLMADVQQCPADMVLLPAGVGHAASCIDKVAGPVKFHDEALSTCMSAGKTLCSFVELRNACGQGLLDRAAKYLVLESDGSSPAAIAGDTCAFAGLSNNQKGQSLCCMR